MPSRAAAGRGRKQTAFEVCDFYDMLYSLAARAAAN